MTDITKKQTSTPPSAAGLDRRTFFLQVGGALIAVPAVLHATACGGGGDDAPIDGGGQISFQVSNSDSAGHTHQLTIQCADLTRSTVTYTTSEGNAHTHNVTLSGTQLASIAGGSTVPVSITTPHAHTWNVTKPVSACG